VSRVARREKAGRYGYSSDDVVARAWKNAVHLTRMFGSYDLRRESRRSLWRRSKTLSVVHVKQRWRTAAFFTFSAACLGLCTAPSICRRSCSIQTEFSTHFRKPRVAVVFYGLPRGLSVTTPYIYKNVYGALSDGGIQYQVYYHRVLYEEVFSNPRNGELNIVLNTTEWSLLRPDVALVLKHSDFLTQYVHTVENVLEYGDVHKNAGLSVKNELEALNSMRQAVRAVVETREKFDGMLVLRPDLLYHDKLDIGLLKWAISRNVVVTPGWQLWDGFNDRFAYGAWEPMLAVGNRFERVLEFCKLHNAAWHAETFLKWVILGTEGQKTSKDIRLKHCHTRQRASRVRAHDKIHEEKFKIDESTFIDCHIR